MKRFNLLSTLFLSFSLVFFQACNDDKDDLTSRVLLILVDAPGDYLEVNVEIVDIQYNSSEDEEGWKSFTSESGYPINVDLTQLIAGNTLLLTDQIIPSGMLHQIRLILGENNTLVMEAEGEEAGEPTPLDTPSAMQSGLKLNLNEELEPGFSYTFILDWIVEESIIEAGASGKYNLKPVIRVNAEVNSGSISGNVIEVVDEAPVTMANVTINVYTMDDVFVTDTMTDQNGNFLVQGLPGGSYKLKITHEGYADYESLELVVILGEVLDVGTIELVLSE